LGAQAIIPKLADLFQGLTRAACWLDFVLVDVYPCPQSLNSQWRLAAPKIYLNLTLLRILAQSSISLSTSHLSIRRGDKSWGGTLWTKKAARIVGVPHQEMPSAAFLSNMSQRTPKIFGDIM
jgi:hypothetical protein